MSTYAQAPAHIPDHSLSMAGKNHVMVTQKGYRSKIYSLSELLEEGSREDGARRAVLLRAYDFIRVRIARHG